MPAVTPATRAQPQGVMKKHLGELQRVRSEALKVPPISEHGNVREIADYFGGAERLKEAVDQLQVLHDEDLVYDRVGPFQQEMGLMELERKYGDFEAGQALAQETPVWMMKTEQGWRLAEPDATQQV